MTGQAKDLREPTGRRIHYSEFKGIIAKQGWSIADFARKAGYDPESVYSWSRYGVPKWGDAFIAVMRENEELREKAKTFDRIVDNWYLVNRGLEDYKSKEITRD